MSSSTTSMAQLRKKYANISNAAEDRTSSPAPAKKQGTKPKTVDIGLALGSPLVFNEGEEGSYQAVYSSASGKQTGKQVEEKQTISIGGVRQNGNQYVRTTFPLDVAVALAEAILTAAEVHPVFMEGRKVYRKFSGKGNDKKLVGETVVEGTQTVSAPASKKKATRVQEEAQEEIDASDLNALSTDELRKLAQSQRMRAWNLMKRETLIERLGGTVAPAPQVEDDDEDSSSADDLESRVSGLEGKLDLILSKLA